MTDNSTAQGLDDMLIFHLEDGTRIHVTGQNLCGNDQVQAHEACDGSDLDGATCEQFGFSGGVLGCTEYCETFDSQGCIP